MAQMKNPCKLELGVIFILTADICITRNGFQFVRNNALVKDLSPVFVSGRGCGITSFFSLIAFVSIATLGLLAYILSH